MVFQTGDGERLVGIFIDVLRLEADQVAFPVCPGFGGFQTTCFVFAEQHFVIRRNQAAAFFFGDGREEFLPLCGINLADAARFVEPRHFGRAAQEYPAQNESGNAFGMGFGIRERQGAAPRAAEHQPFLDAQHFADFFDVGNQVPSRVVIGAGVRQRTAAAALVDDDDAEHVGIEKAAAGRRCARAGSAVQENDGQPVGIAGFFPVDLVDVRYLQQAAADGFADGVHDVSPVV